MRDADLVGDVSGVMDILSGTTRAFLLDRRAVIVELQCNANNVIAACGQQCRNHG